MKGQTMRSLSAPGDGHRPVARCSTNDAGRAPSVPVAKEPIKFSQDTPLEGSGFELPVPRENLLSTPSITASGKGPNASFTSEPHLVPHHQRKPFAWRSADAAREQSSRIVGTKLLSRRPVLCAKCRPHGANLTRRAEWF